MFVPDVPPSYQFLLLLSFQLYVRHETLPVVMVVFDSVLATSRNILFPYVPVLLLSTTAGSLAVCVGAAPVVNEKLIALAYLLPERSATELASRLKVYEVSLERPE